MRIALVIYRADAARGGAERYTVDLAAALVQRGHDVSLLSSDGAAPAGVRAIQLPCRALTRRGEYDHFLDSVDQQVRTSGYDIVHAMLPVRHCDVYHPHSGLAAEAIEHGHERHGTVLRRRLSFIGNRLSAKRQRVAQVERQLLNQLHPPIVLCLSDYIKSEVHRHYAIDQRYLVRLFNAVDLRRFTPDGPDRGQEVRRRLGIDSGATVALLLAQDFGRKGCAVAIRAMAKLRRQDLVLLVGGRDNPAPYRRLARDLGVEARVIFAGTTDDPVSFYQASDFFVLPTRHDPCSLVVLEALAMGLPVISTRFNGACEIMTHAKHGFILDEPGDVAALADAMDRLYHRQQRWLQSAAVRALRPQLEYAKHVDRLLEIYAMAIAQRSKAASSHRLI